MDQIQGSSSDLITMILRSVSRLEPLMVLPGHLVGLRADDVPMDALLRVGTEEEASNLGGVFLRRGQQVAWTARIRRYWSVACCEGSVSLEELFEALHRTIAEIAEVKPGLTPGSVHETKDGWLDYAYTLNSDHLDAFQAYQEVVLFDQRSFRQTTSYLWLFEDPPSFPPEHIQRRWIQRIQFGSLLRES